MKYYIIAGEASGDLHGSNLIKSLIKLDHNIEVRAWGGDLMEETGAKIVKHYRELAFMGFVEVIKNLGTILKNITFCKKDITDFEPDVLILIDYPGFNLRIAKWAKTKNIKVVYYISPQIWAWKENRIKTIKSSVDKMLVILPFESEFYNKWNYHVDYVGHPLVEVVDTFIQNQHTSRKNWNDRNVIGILPGSRKQEINIKLPIMLEVAKQLPEYQFVVAKAPGIEDAFYQGLLKDLKNVSTLKNQTYSLLYEAKAALVTSGTATLETALFGVPQIICYKGSSISYEIAKRIIKIKYIGLVNLIMNKPVVKELIQNDLTTENIISELKMMLENPSKQHQIFEDYAQLKNILASGGDASNNAAKIIFEYLKPPSISKTILQ
jgi:lipid-A-disaccharide synthase